MIPETGVAWYLKTEHAAIGEHQILRLGGRLGRETSHALQTALLETAARGHSSVLVDLAAVDYLSSAGLTIIQSVASRLAAERRELVLFNLTDPVKVALLFIGTIPNVIIEESEASAIEREHQ
jgi:anti-anti-sigma factor